LSRIPSQEATAPAPGNPPARALRFRVGHGPGDVSALLVRPAGATALYVMAHGAGAGMRHPFMDKVARGLADQGIATFRYQFPYMEAGRKAPDRVPVLQATVRAAVDEARRRAPDLALLAGGRSMGGRMTSLASSSSPLPGVCGLAFLGFPLHPAGRPAPERGAHLFGVGLPMLFLQGSRDALADLTLLRPLLASVRPPPVLHVVEGADHGFHVLKRSGRSDAQVPAELCDRLSSWVRRVLAGA